MKIKFLLFSFIFFVSQMTWAYGWSVNVGYNNPPGAEVGLNFMKLWNQWAFEIGAGYAKVGKDSNNKDSTLLAGDLNFKYLFSSGGFRPYFQFGTGYGFATSGGSADLGVGGSLFGGVGFFALGSKAYGYTSYNIGQGDGFFQIGLGTFF